MKQIIAVLFLISATLLMAESEKPQQTTKDFLASMDVQTYSSKILKVFSAQSKDAVFIAYLVKWEGKEIIVTDMFSGKAKKTGDSISFISQSLDMEFLEGRKKMLQFIVSPEINTDHIHK